MYTFSARPKRVPVGTGIITSYCGAGAVYRYRFGSISEQPPFDFDMWGTGLDQRKNKELLKKPAGSETEK
jgi:hypothetical protein